MKKKKLRVLIACEFSGIVRSAFEKRGWDSWSCDLLPSELPGQHHIGDALEFAQAHVWDLIIAHPPCTYLANSGAKHLYLGMNKKNGKNPERWIDMRIGARFFRELLLVQSTHHIAVENPVMLGHAQKIVGIPMSFSIQPWQFGHGEIKRTCFWTRNLPALTPTNIVEGRNNRVHFASPGPDRWKFRSRTLTGIAQAMADQWGSYIENLTLPQ
jgi:hypothetical protein